MITRMVLFGATGDLAGRFLLPALARLQASGHIPADFRVVGAAREGWDDAAFQHHAAQQLEEHASDLSDELRGGFVRCLRYRRVDFADADSVASVVAAAQSSDDPGAVADGGDGTAAGAGSSGSPEPVVGYLALPAAVFGSAVEALDGVGLPTEQRFQEMVSEVALRRASRRNAVGEGSTA